MEKQFIVEERKDWKGTKYWVVIVDGYEEREFWSDSEDTEETAYGWAEGRGYITKNVQWG